MATAQNSNPYDQFDNPYDQFDAGGTPERGGKAESPGIMDRAGGVLETAATAGTGFASMSLAGLRGLARSAEAAVRGEPNPLERGAERVESAMRGEEPLSFAPYQAKTETGQEIMEAIAPHFEQFGRDLKVGGKDVVERTGSPAAATAMETYMEFMPGLFGTRTFRNTARQAAGLEKKPTMSQRRRDVKRVDRTAKETGVDLAAKKEEQIEQLGEFAGRKTVGMSKGASLPNIQKKVKQAKEARKKYVDDLYQEARDAGGKVRISEVRRFRKMAQDGLELFDIDDMPKIKKRLKEVDEIASMENGWAKLNAMEKWRKRINRQRPSKVANAEEHAAHGALKGMYDEWLESQFNADMISSGGIGADLPAINKWKKATQAYKRYKETFSDQKVIKQLAEQEATPEQARKWVFGASAVGAKPEAASTIRSIKKLVGEDSLDFLALRNDALLDLFEPLLREEPSVKQFVKKYDDMRTGHKSVMDELFSDDQLREIRNLAVGIKRSKGAGPPDYGDMFDRIASVFAVGHEMAQASAKRLGLQTILRAVRMPANKRQILGEIMGYDPGKPLIPKTPAVTVGTIQTLEEQGE